MSSGKVHWSILWQSGSGQKNDGTDTCVLLLFSAALSPDRTSIIIGQLTTIDVVNMFYVRRISSKISEVYFQRRGRYIWNQFWGQKVQILVVFRVHSVNVMCSQNTLMHWQTSSCICLVISERAQCIYDGRCAPVHSHVGKERYFQR